MEMLDVISGSSLKQMKIECEFSEVHITFPANKPRVFHDEKTWKQKFPRRFNVEYKWSICRVNGLINSFVHRTMHICILCTV